VRLVPLEGDPVELLRDGDHDVVATREVPVDRGRGGGQFLAESLEGQRVRPVLVEDPQCGRHDEPLGKGSPLEPLRRPASGNCHANSLTATGGLFLLVDTSPTINGNLTLNSNVTYQPDFFPLSGIDRLNVGGAVTLGNSVLDVKALFASQPSGDNFIVINKTSAGSVQGNFKNLPEGATLMIKGVPFRISYIGGDGNDVVLSKAPPVLLIEEGTTHAVTLDSVTLVSGPFKILTEHNFSADHHTRVLLFTSNLGLTQPDPSVLTVQAGQFNLEVENVGTLKAAANGIDCSYIVVRLPDSLPPGDYQISFTLRGVASNTGVLSISP